MYNNLNILQMGYNLYDEYLERYYQNAINYAKQKGLPIRYFHIRADQSKNYDPETKIQITAKEFKYDVYEFVQIIDMSMPVQQTIFDPTQQGTTYSVSFTCTIIGIQNPLPGDLINFYDVTGNMYIDETEVFRVKNVHYIRSMNKKIPIYQLEVENAPYKKSTLDEIMAHKMVHHYFYFADTGQFFEQPDYPYFNYLKDNKSLLRKKFQDIYCKVNATFNVCNFDSAIKILQRNYNFPNPFPIAKVYKDYDISDLMLAFDLLYKALNRDPITNTTLFKEGVTIQGNINGQDTNINIKTFNALEEVSDNTNSNQSTNTYIVSYKDTTCDSPCLSDENKNKEIQIFYLEQNEDTYNLKVSEFFDYYNELYKYFYCYRKLDPDFYNKTSINKNTLQIIKDNEYFYNLQSLSLTTYEQMYNPGYYISYEGGAVYFENGVGITQ